MINKWFYDVSQFILGHIFYCVYNNRPTLLPVHIKEQFSRRLAHRFCKDLCRYECMKCGCELPKVLFAPKGCFAYPKLEWSQSKWEKQSHEIHVSEIASLTNARKEVKLNFPNIDESEYINYIAINRSFYGDTYVLKTVIIDAQFDELPDTQAITNLDLPEIYVDQFNSELSTN